MRYVIGTPMWWQYHGNTFVRIFGKWLIDKTATIYNINTDTIIMSQWKIFWIANANFLSSHFFLFLNKKNLTPIENIYKLENSFLESINESLDNIKKDVMISTLAEQTIAIWLEE